MAYILLEYLLYVSLVAALGLVLFAGTATFLFLREGAPRLAATSRQLAQEFARRARTIAPTIAFYPRSLKTARVPVTTAEDSRTAA